MPKFNSIECPKCHKKGPYMGGCDTDNDKWYLACLFCGHVINSNEETVKIQLWLQQVVGGQSCPVCHHKGPAVAIMLDNTIAPENAVEHVKFFQCSNCGFRVPMRASHFENYINRIGNLLNE